MKELKIGCGNVKPYSYVMSSLEKVLGYLKKTLDYCLVLEFPQAGEDYVKKGESDWCLETFPDSDCSGNKSHRMSTSGGFHALSSGPLFNSSRTQKIMSLSSREADLPAIASSAQMESTFGQFWNLLLGQRCTITFHRFIERQLVTKRGVFKSETFRWKVAMDSEQERLQDGTSTAR